MKKIGIKLADGSFYPILDEGEVKTRKLDLTTAHDKQKTVQVELYRSETGSMEDAEYVDTLVVKHLKAHPIEETELHLSVGLDENNELTAKVIDDETGKESEIVCQLASKTIAEEMNDDFGNDLDSEVEKATVSDDILDEPFSFDSIDTDIQTESAEDTFDDIFEESKEESEPEAASDDMDFADFTVEEDKKDPTNHEVAADDEPEETVSFDSLDDIGSDFAEDESAEKEENSSDDDFELPDFENLENESKLETETSAEGEPAFDDFGKDNSTADDFSAEDFTSEIAEPETDESSEASGLDGFFDDIKDEDFSTEDMDKEIDGGDSSFDDEIDFGDMEPKEPSYHDKATPGSSMDFSDLYDEETLNREDEEDVVKRKTRAPVIICIICAIICILATLLILFVVPSKYNLLGKRSVKVQETTVIAGPTAEELEAEKARAEAAEKKSEEERIAREKAEAEAKEAAERAEAERLAKEEAERKAKEAAAIVPVPPQPKKATSVTYKIKWGDTLWDISESYYKTPWKYKKIAKDNKIKNPDMIISGTTIQIKDE